MAGTSYFSNFVFIQTLQYTGGGGTRIYSSDSPTDFGSNSRLERLADASNNVVGFRLTYPDGRQETFAFMVDFDTGEKWFFRTQERDAYGHTTQFTLSMANDVVQLSNVVDGDGRTTTLSYDSTYPNLIQTITDPFNHTAQLSHDASGRLTGVTDVFSLASSFGYDANGYIISLTTPYGTTSFGLTGSGPLVADNSINRAVEVSEPNGGTQLFLYRQLSSLLNSGSSVVLLNSTCTSLPASPLPDGSWDSTQMDRRNSFHWNQHQWQHLTESYRNSRDFNQLTANDYRIARLQHWLAHNTAGDPGKILSMEQAPSPDGTTAGQQTWYRYDGQSAPYNREGSQALPSVVGRIMPDTSTQYAYYQRNDLGNPTQIKATYGTSNPAAVRTYDLSYDNNKIDLLSVTGPYAGSAPGSGTPVTSYTYNGSHQVTQFTNAKQEVTTLHYDGSGRLADLVFPSGFKRVFTYPASGPNANFPATIQEIVTANNQFLTTESFTYANALPATHTDARGLTRNFTWDALNRLTSIGFPDNTTITYNYNERLDLVSHKDRLGHWTYFGYDKLGRQITSTNALGATNLVEYCGCGSPERILDALHQEFQFTYDDAGRLTEITYPNAKQIHFEYDALGRLKKRTDSANHFITYGYNQQGRLTAVDNALGPVLRLGYDLQDRPTTITDANGVTTTQTFDELGRLLSRSQLHGGSTLSETWGYTANVAGPISYTDPAAKIAHFAYDVLGHKTSEVLAYGTAEAVTLDYTYPNGLDLATLQDGNGHVTTWQYDVYGRVTDKLDANGASVFHHAYDANGQVTTRRTPSNTAPNSFLDTTYSYDAVGNLTGITYPSSHAIAWVYDKLNRPVTLTDGVGTTQFTYDFDGFLTAEDGPWDADTVTYTPTDNRLRASLSLAQPGASAWVQNYGYDTANRMNSLVSPAGTFGYEYSGAQGTTVPGTLIKKLSLLNGASINRLYDDMARVTEINFKNASQAALLSHRYPSYDNASRRLQHLRFDNSYINYTYDSLGQLKTASGYESSGSPRLHEQFTYDYDGAGNVTHRTKNALGTTFALNNVNQLSSASRSGTLTVAGAVNSAISASSVTINNLAAELYGDQTFARAGFTLNDGNTTFTTVAQGSGQSAANNVTVYAPQTLSFQNDANGNLSSDGRRNLVYDEENQLIQVTIGTGWRTEFVYDGLGRKRVTRDCLWLFNHWMTNETRYVYDGYCVLQERNGSNQSKTTYTRGLDLSGSLAEAGGIGGLLARTDNVQLPSAGAHAYYFADGNGNITALMDNNLQVVGRYLYDPYGSMIGVRGKLASANLYRFSTKEYHPFTMLYNFGFRHYDPNLQRWTSKDPIGELGGISLYGFVDNDPVDRIEPQGLYPTLIHDPYTGFFGYVDSYDLYYLGMDAVVNGETLPRDATGFVPGMALEDQPISSLGGESLSMVFGAELAGALLSLSMLDAQFVLGPLNTPNDIAEAFREAGIQSVNGCVFGKAVSYSQAGVAGVLPVLTMIGGVRAGSTRGAVEQYSLRAADSGFYPVMVRTFQEPQFITFLHRGDVWKFGTTRNPSTRYSQLALQNIGEHGVIYVKEFSGTSRQAIKLQNMKIDNFIVKTRRLPPGNKIRN